MITSIGSSRETLAEILAKLNAPATDSTASTKNTTGLKTVDDLSMQFQENLINFLMKTQDSTEQSKEETINLEQDEENDLLTKLGKPAGLDLDGEFESPSLVEKIKNMNFMKAFDLDKDGQLTKNDFNVAKEKSPLVANAVNAFNSAVKDETGLTNQASKFIQSMINQYKDNPLSAITQAAEIFA